LGIRPEHLNPTRGGPGWRGTITTTEHLGSGKCLFALFHNISFAESLFYICSTLQKHLARAEIIYV
jgi:hypothetical protein